MVVNNRWWQLSARDALWLAALVVAGLVLRLGAIGGYPHQPVSDELAYLSMAQNLVQHGEVIDVVGNRALYNAGYPMLVLAPVMVVFGDSLIAMRVANALLGALTIVLCYAVARQAGAGVLGARLAAAMFALYLPASVYTVYLAKESLMTPLMLGVIGCGVLITQRVSARLALCLGVLTGLLALTGNAGLALGAAIAVALLSPQLTWRKRIVFSVMTLAVAAAVVAPWVARNQQVLGAPVLNTNGGFNLYLGNNPVATGLFVSVGDTPAAEVWHSTLKQHGELAATQAMRQLAVGWITEHPAEFVALAARKAALFWTPPWHAGQGPGSTVETLLRAAWSLQYLLIVGAALAGFALASLRHRPIALIWIAVAAYTAVHMLFYVIYRYREPIMPLLIVLAALTLEQAWLRWTSRRRAGQGPASAAKVVGA